MGRYYNDWEPYKSVGQRKLEGEQAAKKLLKKGQTLSPVTIPGTKIATTFWGKAWCDYIEIYSDYDNRLPRGRTYARNGSILDLQISRGTITALVCGSELYKIKIKVKPMKPAVWKAIATGCASSIHSVIDLMRGKLSDEVIGRLTDPKNGMFPGLDDVEMSCSCPDSAELCKHLAGVLYGIGHRLDQSPELLFVLRNVDQQELISASTADAALSLSPDEPAAIPLNDLGSIFGIELVSPTAAIAPDHPAASPVTEAPRKPAARKGSARKAVRSKTATSKTVRPSSKKASPKKASSKKSGLKKTGQKKTGPKKASSRKSVPAASRAIAFAVAPEAQRAGQTTQTSATATITPRGRKKRNSPRQASTARGTSKTQ